MWWAYSAACSGITRSTEVAAAPRLSDFNRSRRDTGSTDMLDLSFSRLVDQVLGSPPRQGRDRQRRVLVRAGHEARAIAHEQVLDVMRLAIFIQDRRLGIVAHTHRAQFMDDLSALRNAIGPAPLDTGILQGCALAAGPANHRSPRRLNNRTEGFLHILRHFEFVIAPGEVKAQHRNAPF